MMQPPFENQNRSMLRWWIIGSIAIVFAIVLIVVVNLPPPLPPPTPTRTSGSSTSNPKAPILVEEYGDFQCPACGMFARGTLKQIQDKYVKNGTVKFVFHYFAFIGEESIRASEAAECANEQGKFWEYYDTLYNHQAGENQGAFSADNLANFAQQLELDMNQFNTCLTSDRYRDKVMADIKEGQTRGVTQVPTLFINGQKSVGAISMVQFEAIIAPFLK